jgi:hypothetical protein
MNPHTPMPRGRTLLGEHGGSVLSEATIRKVLEKEGFMVVGPVTSFLLCDSLTHHPIPFHSTRIVGVHTAFKAVIVVVCSCGRRPTAWGR